jgi:hypothetical protein
LLGVGTSAWPLGNDIFLGLVVGGESEGDTGEGSTKVNADNQLGLAPAGALDLGGRVASLELLGDGTAAGGRVAWRISGLTSKGGRPAHGGRTLAHLVHVGRVSERSAGVDGGRASGHLRRRGTVRTWAWMGEGAGATERRALGRGRIVGRVAGWAIGRIRVIHGETGGRGR